MKLYFWVIILCFIFTNCEKEVNINFPKHKIAPVLNCLFSQDSVFKVHISKSAPILNNFRSRIGDATVQLFEDDKMVEELSFDGSIYGSSIIPQPKKIYRIEANTPEFQHITAFDYIPTKPHIISASFKDSVYKDEDGFDMSQAKIKIQDNPNNKDYYELILVSKPIGPYYSVSYDMTNNDPVLLNEDILEYLPEYLVFSDELFDGKNYTFTVNYGTPVYNDEQIKHELTIYLRHISENYYKYKKRLLIHLYNQDSDIWDGIGDPVPMYTNIENGFGIFAGYSQIKKIIQN